MLLTYKTFLDYKCLFWYKPKFLIKLKHMSSTKLKTFVCIIVCMYNYKTHSRCMNYFNVSCTKPQTALIKLCSVYTLVVTILIHMYCTVHCLICNYHQLEMIINSLAMVNKYCHHSRHTAGLTQFMVLYDLHINLCIVHASASAL